MHNKNRLHWDSKELEQFIAKHCANDSYFEQKRCY